METVLRNFGNSVGLVIPKQVREALHMQAGQTVQLETSAQWPASTILAARRTNTRWTRCWRNVMRAPPHRRINSPPGMTRHRLGARRGKRPSF